MIFDFIKSIIKFLTRVFKKRKTADGDIFYINGSSDLPAPLTPEEEAALVSAFRKSPEAIGIRNTLIEHNLRLVVYIAKKYDNTGIGTEDLVSIGTIGLIKAIKSYDPDKNIKLATYASKCIDNEILMFIRKTSCIKNEVSIEEPLNTDREGNELLLSDILGSDGSEVHKSLENEEEKSIIMRAVASLDKRDRTIIELRFGMCGREELTQKQVADMLGISQSYISRLEKRIIDKLRREICGKI
ncbi:RNA polymerase sigma-35 factor [bioreactor metagenome]|uniref:RNA polymerase sigma-35 factor n=1 Tax=bioreactor metagenome TaxID=1076179 RepID=A0A645C8V7_9ZZZZ|nr:sigma-70 family RNA polymerase sigma factor [Oscillospiraceae bacterium]